MPKIKQIKYSQELTFLVAAVLILIILVISVSWILGFVISRLNTVLNPGVLQPPTVSQFNIEEFERLGLVKSGE